MLLSAGCQAARERCKIHRAGSSSGHRESLSRILASNEHPESVTERCIEHPRNLRSQSRKDFLAIRRVQPVVEAYEKLISSE